MHRLCISLCLLLCTIPAFATTLVLIPEHPQTISGATQAILGGVRSAAASIDVVRANPARIDSLIASAEDRVAGVIVIGRTLIEAVDADKTNLPILGGGIVGPVDPNVTFPTRSLAIDAAILLDEIEKVGLPLESLWTVTTGNAVSTHVTTEIARLAPERGFVFWNGVTHDLASTAKTWFDVLNRIDPQKDAILIADEQYLDESGTYRFLMETAWRQNLLVVSSLPDFAQRGVSIGFIPDLHAYGNKLIETLEQLVSSGAIETSEDLGLLHTQRVFNQRTLEKIGRRLPNDLDKYGRDDILIK